MTKRSVLRFILLICALAAVAGLSASEMHDSGRTTASDAAWVSLFNGRDLEGWTNPMGGKVGPQWQVIDAELVLVEGGGGDIVTVDTFENFELRLEWRISEGGNSGIFFRVVMDGNDVWMSGPEYQILDDFSFPALIGSRRTTGAVFDLHAPQAHPLRPLNQFNETTIRVEGGQVRYWLNGEQIAEFEIGSQDWEQRVAASKFSIYEQFGVNASGHIALQDHGNPVWFKNIRVRGL